MRNLIFLLSFLFLFASAQGQKITEASINAFSESYKNEVSKDYEKAITAIKNVYSANSYEMNLRLGWLYFLKKEYIQSAKYYKTAISVQPKSIEAMLGLVNPGAELQNWTEVFDTYKRILQIDPYHSVANYRIALMYYYRKDYTNGQMHLQKVLDLYPFDYDSMLLMAQTKLAAGKITEAKSWYQKVLLYNPGDTTAKKALEKL
jgi:tetratricopeptide (TPR) repeat protein